MKIIGVIPARYKSTRFPGKPLADICGINLAVYAPAVDKLIDAIGYDRHNAEGRFVRKN